MSEEVEAEGTVDTVDPMEVGTFQVQPTAIAQSVPAVRHQVVQGRLVLE